MNKEIQSRVVVLLLVLAPCFLFAGESAKEKREAAWLAKLSTETRSLLRKEMHFLESGIQQAVVALASGDFDELYSIGHKMKESYILAQGLSKKQRHELHHTLPKSFALADAKFHHYAGMLAHVAEKKNSELSVFYLSKITESCVSCHQAHARHRFPGFELGMQQKSHSH